MMVILGGMGNFVGAMVGAFTFEMVLHVLKDLPTIQVFGNDINEKSTGSYGWGVSSFLWWYLPHAVYWVWSNIFLKINVPRQQMLNLRTSRRARMAELLLSAKNLTKRFGGLAAVNNVSVDLYRGQIHAVIGPNGAGKSTLTNLVSGDLPLTSGSITLNGKDISGWQAEKISRQGLGRSQKTNVFLPLSVWDNV